MSSILPHWSYAVSMREIDTEFGEWIEDNYRRVGLTQREFAEHLLGRSLSEAEWLKWRQSSVKAAPAPSTRSPTPPSSES